MRSICLCITVLSTTISFSLSAFVVAAPTPPTPLAKFTVPGLGPNDYLGWSLATDGQRVLIGTGLGSAYLYDPFTRQQLAKVALPRADIGTSVALQGNSGVVAGPSGAYLYDFKDLANISRTTLSPNDNPASFVGFSVDMSGDVIIAGAIRDSAFGTSSGAAYLFDRVTGTQIAKLVANDAQPNDDFGYAVAIDNSLAAVTALQPLSRGEGAVYLFDAEPNTIGNRQLAKYIAAPAVLGQFGDNLDLNGETLVATQSYNQAFMWPIASAPSPLAASSSDLGADGISMSDDYVALGIAHRRLIRIYDKTGNIVGNLTPPPGGPTFFGGSVAIDGDLLVVSAGNQTPETSVVYVYRVQDCLVPEPHSMALASLGFFGAIAFRKRSRR